MKVELKDFQGAAAATLLDNLEDMRTIYEQRKRLTATCLQAPTGSGKTVISAYVIESLFFGNDEMDVDADDGAVVLWLSDSPSLNEQTRSRFVAASEKLADWDTDERHLETIGNNFCASHEELEGRHVYFLSKDLLSASGLLVKGGEHNGGRVFWDVLNRTIADSRKHLYLFIDEAHRGLGTYATSDRGTSTIYANLIDGVDARLPMPIVVGISATPQRFENAMLQRANRMIIPSIEVTPQDVQESGLLKDTVELRVPEKDDPVEHQYLDLACERFDKARRAWTAYCDAEGIERVAPLLVVQVRDGISPDGLKSLCDQITHKLPDIDQRIAFAHVFGTHTDITPSKSCFIPYIHPESVTERKSIQVLFAKEAISNGWDCPRAEVIFSERRRSDATYIAQLVGRMVRTPLARRIEADESLNAVACYLPQFNPDATKAVVDYLTGKTDDMGGVGVPNVVVDPIDVRPATPKDDEDYAAEEAACADAHGDSAETDPAVNGEGADTSASTVFAGDFGVVGQTGDAQDETSQGWLAFDAETTLSTDNTGSTSDGRMPTEQANHTEKTHTATSQNHTQTARPKRDSSFTKADWAGIQKAWTSLEVLRVPKGSDKNAFKSLLDTATLLMETELDTGAGARVRMEFCNQLEGAMVTYRAAYETARHDVEVAEMQVITIDKRHGNTVTTSSEAPKADLYGIKTIARGAVKVYGGDELVNAYRRHCLLGEGGSPMPDTREMELRVAAIALCDEIVHTLQTWARNLRNEYLENHDKDRDYLSEEERQEYDRLLGESGLTVRRHVAWPESMPGGVSGKWPRFPKHILQDEDGTCPLDLKGFERFVLEKELERSQTVAFYRNPSASRSAQVFSINYTAGSGNRSALHPDFIFFTRDSEGTIRPAIVDPHGVYLADAVAKLKGYVKYLREFPDAFVQVLSVTTLRGTNECRYINLLDDVAQEAILSFSDVDGEALYQNPKISRKYGEYKSE